MTIFRQQHNHAMARKLTSAAAWHALYYTSLTTPRCSPQLVRQNHWTASRRGVLDPHTDTGCTFERHADKDTDGQYQPFPLGFWFAVHAGNRAVPAHGSVQLH